MTTHTELGARASPEESSGRRLVQQGSTDQRADGDATKDYGRSPHTDRSVLEQLMHNLMMALGALPI